jgi:hypothetical protein
LQALTQRDAAKVNTAKSPGTQGKVALYFRRKPIGRMRYSFGMTTAKAPAPFLDYDKNIRACDTDAIMTVALSR